MAKVNTEIEYFGETTDWKRKGEKIGGARKAGADGGVYEYIGYEAEGGLKRGTIALIKKDNEIEANIAEFLGSKLFSMSEPDSDSGAKVKFMALAADDPSGKTIPFVKGDGSNVYVRSEFHANGAGDMYKHMDANMKENKPNWFMRAKGGRPWFMGTRELFSKTYTKAFKDLKYQDFDKTAPLSLLMQDDDLHPGNNYIIQEPGKNPRLFRIDFGCAFNNLSNDINPNTYSRNIPGRGPTNHFREFPKHLKLTPEFVEGLNRAADPKLMDMDKYVEESFAEMQKYYNDKAIGKWAQKAMPSLYKDKLNIDIDDVKADFKTIMQNRQKSLKEYSMQIELGHLIGKTPSGNYQVKNQARLNQLILDNPDYFNDINEGDRKIKLEDPKFKGDAKKFLKNEIKQVLKEQPAIYNPVDKVKDSAAVPSVAANANIIEPPVVMHMPSANSNVEPTNNPSTKQSSSITQNIRDEITITQQLFVQREVAEIMPKDQREDIASLDMKKFNEFLHTPEGQEKFSKIMHDPSTVSALLHLEEVGYKQVHSNLEKNFKPLDWATTKSHSEIRISKILDNQGNIITELKETTISTPTPLMLENAKDNAKEKDITRYRIIDFPPHLDQPKEAHFSIALKDEEGKNMPKKDAVYFTAHYDEAGKLNEVTSPIPVKFMGTDSSAIGYIEREGKIFTLPVTREKYTEMLIEVAKNKGLSMDMSIDMKVKDIEISSDAVAFDPKAVTKEKTTSLPLDTPAHPKNRGAITPDLLKETKKILKGTHADDKIVSSSSSVKHTPLNIHTRTSIDKGSSR